MRPLSILQNQVCKSALMPISAGCLLSSFSMIASADALQGYVLDIEMTPALCALDKSKQKQRRCLEGYSLTIAGLLPETGQKNCTTTSSPKLSPLQAKVVAKVMPEENSRNRLWYAIGGCIPMNASQYFRNMINKAESLKVPKDVTGFGDKVVQQSNLKSQFLKLNPKLLGESIRFTCHGKASNAILSGIQVCYKTNGQFKQCSSQLVSNCPASFSIKGTY